MRIIPMLTTCTLGAALLAAGMTAFAQSVGLQGMLGSKALLIVDGNPPRSCFNARTRAFSEGESFGICGVAFSRLRGMCGTPVSIW